MHHARVGHQGQRRCAAHAVVRAQRRAVGPQPAVLDRKTLVSNTQAIEALRELTEKEGIFAGVSCGAVMVAAKQLASEMPRGTIVALLADGGWKYLSEDIWTRDLRAAEEVVDSLNLW